MGWQCFSEHELIKVDENIFPKLVRNYLTLEEKTTSVLTFLLFVGYCPQFDSIIGEMTGREMLTLFARLRGMFSHEIDDEVNHWISEVGIEEYADRKCGTYSGGNKRKLNVAQALVADPPIGSTI